MKIQKPRVVLLVVLVIVLAIVIYESGLLKHFNLTGSQTTSYSFQSYTDQEPYYSTYCDKIDPYDLSVREAEAKAIKNDPGVYSASQLFDIYDWVTLPPKTVAH